MGFITSPWDSSSPLPCSTSGAFSEAAAMLRVTLRLWSSSWFAKPKPFATRARFVQRSVMFAKCHSTISGFACRLSWFRASTSAWIEVASTKLTEEKSRIMARRMGRVSGASSPLGRRGPGSFHGRSYRRLARWSGTRDSRVVLTPFLSYLLVSVCRVRWRASQDRVSK